MEMIGRLLGNRYELIEKIGNGGMATVYKAKCHVLNRYVAVKILRDEFTTDEEFIKRFEVEAQSAASITHQNIVSVYDVGVDGNLYYIVMELVKGKTLKELIVEERGPLPWKWSVNIAIQIASALEVAHKNNIIHRDIKPHNIIITEDGVAKVTDFGIAKAVSNSTITAFGTTIGSVHYFAPEHARGGFTDEKSDLYSLGVVMYEMLTGKVPFDADTPVSVALKHMQEEPIPPVEINRRIPLAVNNIIMKALQKDPNLRYSSGTEMLVDLKRALKEPDGEFVTDNKLRNFDTTQRIDTRTLNEENNKKKKQNKFISFVKKHKVLVTIFVLILLFAGSLGGTMAYFNAKKPKEVAIPNLIGKTVDEAKQILEENKIVFEQASEEYNSEVEAGKIISQTPEFKENRNIKQNTTIKVVVSLGTETTKMPKVKGETKENAEKILKDAKLKAEIVEEISKTVEAGIVIKQDIDDGETLNAGNTVKIYVSIGTGLKQVLVKSVKLKDEATAKKTLEDLGLVVEVDYKEDKSQPNGIVLEQSHNSGETLDEGTTITITVNKIVEEKERMINVNVSKLTNHTEQKDDKGNAIAASKVTVSVFVDDNEKDTTPTTQDNEKYAVKINAIGVVSIKIVIKDSTGKTLVTKTKNNVNMNEDSIIAFD